MKEFAYPLVTSLATWLLSHYYYRKKHKSELEDILMKRLNDLSEKYVALSSQYTDLVDEVSLLRQENKKLKCQVNSLKKGRKKNVG